MLFDFLGCKFFLLFKHKNQLESMSCPIISLELYNSVLSLNMIIIIILISKLSFVSKEFRSCYKQKVILLILLNVNSSLFI